MTTRRLSNSRGLTLIELSISVAMMLVAALAASAVIVAGSNMTAAAERRAGAEDAARLALEAIARSAANAGFGARDGFYIWRNSSSQRVNPVFGTDGKTTGTDDLWLLVSNNNLLREPAMPPNCVAPIPATLGSAAVNYTSGPGTLLVSCITSFTDIKTLLISNGSTGALIVPTN